MRIKGIPHFTRNVGPILLTRILFGVSSLCLGVGTIDDPVRSVSGVLQHNSSLASLNDNCAGCSLSLSFPHELCFTIACQCELISDG